MISIEEVKKEAAKLQESSLIINMTLLDSLLREIQTDVDTIPRAQDNTLESYIPSITRIDYSNYSTHSHGINSDCMVDERCSKFTSAVVRATDPNQPSLTRDWHKFHSQTNTFSSTGVEAADPREKKEVYRPVKAYNIAKAMQRLADFGKHAEYITKSSHYQVPYADWSVPNTYHNNMKRALCEKGYEAKAMAVEKLATAIIEALATPEADQYNRYIELLSQYTQEQTGQQAAAAAAQRDNQEGKRAAALDRDADTVLDRLLKQRMSGNDKRSGPP